MPTLRILDSPEIVKRWRSRRKEAERSQRSHARSNPQDQTGARGYQSCAQRRIASSGSFTPLAAAYPAMESVSLKWLMPL